MAYKSKLNMVDLAGSERSAKTGASGATAREARLINKSLTFLEQVLASLLQVTIPLTAPPRQLLLGRRWRPVMPARGQGRQRGGSACMGDLWWRHRKPGGCLATMHC